MDRPLANRGNGEAEHDGRGRFLPGNRAAVGRGNPNAARVNACRSALAHTVTEADLRAVIAKLVERTKAGERWAVCELLDRCLGKPTQMPEIASAGEVEAENVVLKLQFADRQLINPERAST